MASLNPHEVLGVMGELIQMGYGLTALLLKAFEDIDLYCDSANELKELAMRSQKVQTDFFAIKDAVFNKRPVLFADLEKIKIEMQKILTDTLTIIRPSTASK